MKREVGSDAMGGTKGVKIMIIDQCLRALDLFEIIHTTL